ncbi:MAG: 50S ribosomal protein L11 [DPANN group archaeon]|nr:50S ribosomal protein L11 [DPANN group archaeon]
MAKQEKVELMVTGGKASAGPPLGPALAGKGINIGQVVSDINKKTGDMAGMTVPVTVLVDIENKSYDIKVGVPPSSALLKKEAEVESGSGKAGSMTISALTIEHLIKVAKIKQENSLGNTLKDIIKELAGTCVSLGFEVEGMHPKEFTKQVNEGKFDKQINAETIVLTIEKQKEWKSRVTKLKSDFEKAKAAAAAAAVAQATAPAETATATPAKV